MLLLLVLITLWTFNIYFAILNVKKTMKAANRIKHKLFYGCTQHKCTLVYWLIQLAHTIAQTLEKIRINILLFWLEATIFAYRISLLATCARWLSVSLNNRKHYQFIRLFLFQCHALCSPDGEATFSLFSSKHQMFKCQSSKLIWQWSQIPIVSNQITEPLFRVRAITAENKTQRTI